ncbi:unnamed protein product [Pleuronectes platessa]|uniref:Uncharacterized protein n=1 Tax=Pleuronectes platessa TaxID=8262 RepID=A0A9N7VG86_PLEPL|nr:unnamed protein product [Pleuronectes platessa]
MKPVERRCGKKKSGRGGVEVARGSKEDRERKYGYHVNVRAAQNRAPRPVRELARPFESPALSIETPHLAALLINFISGLKSGSDITRNTCLSFTPPLLLHQRSALYSAPSPPPKRPQPAPTRPESAPRS